jgi:hypothetical protein
VTEDSAILESFSRFTVHPTWFLNKASTPTRSNFIKRCCDNLCYNEIFCSRLSCSYLSQRRSRIVLFIIYFLLNIGLLLYASIYRSTVIKSNVFIVFARTSGILLNLNSCLIVVPMLKQTILFIRSHEILRRLIPVDIHIEFHKFIGRFIAILSLIHIIAHVINFARSEGKSKNDKGENAASSTCSAPSAHLSYFY